MKLKLLMVAAVALIATSSVVVPAGAEVQEKTFNVIGTWGNVHNFQQGEKPFWTEELPAVSGGKLKGEIRDFNELSITGFEILRMLRSGTVDMAHGVLGYFGTDSAVIEGVDLAGVTQTSEETREAVQIYRETLEQEFRDKWGAELLMVYSFPSQIFWCTKPVTSLADLQGMKVRTFNVSSADLMRHLGATTLNVPFAELIPALERGVADCAITGSLPVYVTKMWQVTKHVYNLRLGWGVAFLAANEDTWDGLNEETKNLLRAEFAKLEDKLWELNRDADRIGIDCNTDGPCELGEPGGMTLHEPSEDDLAKLKQAVEDSVLATWAERCGFECVETWNASIGSLTGFAAKN